MSCRDRPCRLRLNCRRGQLRMRFSMRLPSFSFDLKRRSFSVSISCLIVDLPSPVMVGGSRRARPMSLKFRHMNR